MTLEQVAEYIRNILRRLTAMDTTLESAGQSYYKSSKVTSVTGTYTVLDSDHIVMADGTFTVNLLPAYASYHIYTIMNTGAGTITVDGDGAETIDGAATHALATGESITIIDSGAGVWRIF